MSSPLVSIMMPCFNAASTLPWALSSILAQEYENWECIVIDDGSVDSPISVVEQANDPRIRFTRFPTNRGRSFARQAAIDAVRGEFVCMLDADDWHFPNRLAMQVEAFESVPSVALVGCGVAIVDSSNWIVGVRGRCDPTARHEINGPLKRFAAWNLVFAPSMIRTEIARRYPFDTRFPIVEDVDFLARLLMDHSHCRLPSVGYAYAEHSSISREKVFAAFKSSRFMYRKYRGRFPIQSRIKTLTSYCKESVYRAGYALNQDDWLVRRRSSPPTEADIMAFEQAHARVSTVVREVFGAREAQRQGVQPWLRMQSAHPL